MLPHESGIILRPTHHYDTKLWESLQLAKHGGEICNQLR